MSLSALVDVNWLAAIAAAVIYYALGAGWYSRLFLGRRWMRSVGWDETANPPPMTAAAYIGPLIGYLLVAGAIGALLVATDTSSFSGALALGVIVGIGVSAALFYVTAAFDPKRPRPMLWFLITSGYHFVGILITAVLMALWR